MIMDIDEKLVRWAQWQANGHRAIGLGYSPCTLSRMVGGSASTVPFDPIIDIESMNVDRAVSELPNELKEVIVVWYLKPGTTTQKARDCKCSRATFYNRISSAHTRIARSIETRQERTFRA